MDYSGFRTTTDPKVVTDSESEAMDFQAERKNLEETMMINITTMESTTRDAS